MRVHLQFMIYKEYTIHTAIVVHIIRSYFLLSTFSWFAKTIHFAHC